MSAKHESEALPKGRAEAQLSGWKETRGETGSMIWWNPDRPDVTYDDVALIPTRLNEITRIATDVRVRFEEYYEDAMVAPFFRDMCREMARELHEKLIIAGFDARLVPGQYLGMSDVYEPDTSEWDEEAIEAYEGDPRISHWWVECDGKIVDICATQFHPENFEEYRILITDENDPAYEKMHGSEADLSAPTL